MKQPATWKLLLGAFVLIVASGGVVFLVQWYGLRAEFAKRVPERPAATEAWGPEFERAEERAFAGSVDGLSDLGGFYQLSGHHEQAFFCFEGAMQMDPDNAERVLLVAKLQAAQGDVLTAEQTLKTAIELGTDAGWFFAEVGGVWNFLGKPDQALDHLNRAIEMEPTLADAWHQLHLSHVALGDDESSLRAIEAGLKVNPRASKLLLVHAQKLSNQERWDDALVVFDRVIEVEPDLVEGYQMAASVLLKLNRRMDAVDYLQMAWEIEPRDRNTLTLLCVQALLTRNEEDARRWFEALDELPEFSPNDRTALSQLYEQQFGSPIEDDELER